MYLSHNIVKNLVQIESTLAKCGLQEIEVKVKEQIAKDQDVALLFFLMNEIGINISAKDTYKVFGDRQIVTKDFRGQLVENLKKILELSHQLANNSDFTLNATTLIELNQALGQKTTEEWQLNYRAAGEPFSVVYDDLTDLIDPQKQFPEGVNESYSTIVTKLLENYNQAHIENRFYKISQLVYELTSIHPLIAYNKFTIICFAYLLLCREQLPQPNFINPAEFFIHYRSDVRKVLEITESEARELAWHEKFLGFCLQQLSEKSQQLPSVKESKPSKPNKPFLDLNRRQLKILKYLQTIPTLKREDYVQMTGVSAMTAFRDLQALVKYKLIKPIGTGRGTKYTLYSR